MTDTVTAVVVTYNRVTLLVGCIEALLKQTHVPERILIIDNASTDGTADLFTGGGCSVVRRCEYFRLARNIGGAGGFREGMKLAHEMGADWVWVLDDDGRPAPNCLESLLSQREELRIVAPIVCDVNDGRKLAFNYSYDKFSLNSVADLSALGLKRIPVVHPFNGLLVHREVINRIGLPMAEMFIWGDELEYTLRARHTGFEMASISAARFFHPANRMVLQPVLGGMMGTVFEAPLWRNYCYYRNQFVIRRNYSSILSTAIWALRSLAKRIVVGQFYIVWVMMMAFGDAMHGVWGREKEFMKEAQHK